MNVVGSWDIDGAMRWSTAKAERGLRGMTLDAAGLIQGAQRESPRGGRTYGRYTASAPGEAPAIDTGRNVGATFARQPFAVPEGIRSGVVVNTEYAAHLENGTEKMAPRPYIKVTMQNNWDSRLMPIFKTFAR